MRLELLAQGLGQIAHLVKIRSTPLMNPAEQLGGPKALFTQTFAKNGQTFKIEFEKVGRHVVRAQWARYASRSA
jgi:hypothetical protein